MVNLCCGDLNEVFQYYIMIIFGVILTLVTGSGAMTWQGPVNTLVVNGNQTTLTCQANSSFSSFYWYYTAFATSQRRPINQGVEVVKSFEEFQVSGDVPGQHLTLQAAQMKHAGQYTCSALMKYSNTTGKLIESTALLIVLESEPVCRLKNRQVKVGREIELICSLNFSGPFVPAMEWSQHRADDPGEDSVIRDGQINTEVRLNTSISTATITADVSRHNSTYTCRTYFTLPSAPLGVNATNAPSYDYTWTSPSVQVMHGPSEVSIVPKQDIFYPGDVLTCLAEASPIPEFAWINLDSKSVFNGPEMVIRSSMIRHQPYVFQCHITHVLTGSKMASPSIQFTVKNSLCTNTAHTNLWIVVVLVSICVIIIIALSVHVVCLKRRNIASLNGQTRPRNDTVLLAANNSEPVYSEYTEIPAYSVCREAAERCQRPVSNLGYAPMERTSTSTTRCSAPDEPGKSPTFAVIKNVYQNNEYMTADDDIQGPGYAVSVSPRGTQPPTSGATRGTYLDLTERKTSSSADYAALASTDEEKQLLSEEQHNEQRQAEGQTDEQNHYLVPLPD